MRRQTPINAGKVLSKNREQIAVFCSDPKQLTVFDQFSETVVKLNSIDRKKLPVISRKLEEKLNCLKKQLEDFGFIVKKLADSNYDVLIPKESTPLALPSTAAIEKALKALKESILNPGEDTEREDKPDAAIIIISQAAEPDETRIAPAPRIGKL